MLSNVPQFIDVEDKIVGPLTGKQLLWMFAMGGVLLILWGFLDQTAFFISVIPTVLIFVALAFYRPHNQSLIRFIMYGIMFLFRPKIYFWRRIAEKIEKKPSEAPFKEKNISQQDKKMSSQDLETIARTLDTRGSERNARMMEIINRNRKGHNV